MSIQPATMQDLTDPTTAQIAAEDWLIQALAAHGPLVIFAICLASCVALPVPASVALISAGAIAAASDLTLWQLAVAGIAGALIGDQIAYFIGRAGRGPLVRWLDARPKRREARLRAEAWTARHGGPGVLFSRWPISPLGPYVNFATGAAGYPWSRFTAWGAPGEVVWVGINLAAGYTFADPILLVAMVVHEGAGLLLSLAALILVLWGVRRFVRRDHPAE
ncbi:DedA family protein [Pseudooceanicola sp.]|uniref:DedA family protein n=1 Tax=Pseudooceanicola sp. TaxID=1914328 RepID=UPI0040592C19